MSIPNDETALWPSDYNVPANHCRDVVEGSYSVPYSPATPPVCLDIGANVGAFARWAAKTWEGCTLHCYEPNAKIIDLLHRTIDTHNIAAQTHQCAVSDRDGQVTFHEGPNNCGEGSVVMAYGTPTQSVHQMDAAKLPRADVLKMDCEGCELQILTRLQEVGRLFEFSAIMLETHNPSDREKIMALLHENGFTLTRDHIWSRAGGIEYMDPQRSELCYVRADLVPAGFVPDVRDTAPVKPVVWICTPVRTGKVIASQKDFEELPAHYREPIREISNAKNLPWQFQICMLVGGGIARARNKHVQLFLASTAEWLIFQDYDLLPKAQDYVDLLAHAHQWGARIIGGGYTTREKHGHWVINFPDAQGPNQFGGLIVGELGTGFKAYHRSVFLEVRAKNPWICGCMDQDTEEMFDAFFCIAPAKDELVWPGINRWLTEDYWLDWLTRDAGIPTVWDTNISLRHKDGDDIWPKGDFPPIPQRDQKALDDAAAKKLAANVTTSEKVKQDATSSA